MKCLEIKPTERILVIAPHPDDEILGCGGVILKHACQCDVLLLTDGCNGSMRWSEARTRKVRHKEFLNVISEVGIKDYLCLNIHDQMVGRQFDCYRKMDLSIYDKIFVPNRNELHPDHSNAYKQLKLDRLLSRKKCIYYQYEIWTPLDAPTHVIDISDVIEEKKRIIKMYKSQIVDLDYVRLALGLSEYRGAMNQMPFAECYKEGL